MKLKKFIQFNENMDMMHDDMHGDMSHEHSETSHYMFFENLKTIKRLVDELLEMDETEIDEILESGHDWAADHIAVAKVDVEQVFDFLANNSNGSEDHTDFDGDADDDMEDYMSIMQGDGDMSDMTDMEDVDDSDEDYDE